MLFFYKYIQDHSIYTLHQSVEELFREVWCKADPAVEYDIDLLPEKIKELTLAIYYDAKVDTDYLYGPIEKVYKIFQGFSPETKELLAKAFRDNNSIEHLCKQDPDYIPFLYDNLKPIHKELKEALKDFFDNLFSSIIHLKSVQAILGCDIDKHYEDFVTENDEGKCPFCGLNPIISADRSIRDAYDHYLPKGLFPFNSVNFHNLAPMCHECNSPIKSTKNPIYSSKAKQKRKAFYPYETTFTPDIHISIDFPGRDLYNLKSKDINIKIEEPSHQEEVETWIDVFSIIERYQEKCIKKNDGKYWIVQAVDEYKTYPDEVKEIFTREKHVKKIINDAKTNPFAEGNFLKVAFLETCLQKHIFAEQK